MTLEKQETAHPSPVPHLPLTTILGMLLLMWSASVYSAFGLSAYPRQDWIIEALVSVVFLIPVINLLRRPARFESAVRLIGVALLLHSVWDAVHWPSLGWIDTPIDPRIPKFCPLLDLPVGFLLLLRGK